MRYTEPMVEIRRIGRARVGLMATALLAGCPSSDAPETVVRRQVDRAIAAARERDLGDVFADVAKSFSGPNELTLHETRRHVAARLLRPGWMTVFAPRVEVDPPEGGIVRARIDLVVARGRPVEKLEDVIPSQAEHLRVRTASRRVDGVWQFVRAEVDRSRVRSRVR